MSSGSFLFILFYFIFSFISLVGKEKKRTDEGDAMHGRMKGQNVLSLEYSTIKNHQVLLGSLWGGYCEGFELFGKRSLLD